MVEIYWTKMLTVAAILPVDFSREAGLAFEIQLPEGVTAILAFDGTLPRSEESSFVLGTVYFHFRFPLWR